MTTKDIPESHEPATPLGLGSSEGLGPVPARWYVVDADGLATLCKDEADARESASGYWSLYPRRAPYRAVLLGDVAAERKRISALMEAHTGVGLATVEYLEAMRHGLKPQERDDEPGA